MSWCSEYLIGKYRFPRIVKFSMNSYEITYCMRKHKTFLGVFALDNIPSQMRLNDCLIFNSQTQNLPGEHWMALRLSRCGDLFYYDPLGKPPIPSVCRRVLLFARSVRYLTTSTQNPQTSLCGQHCLYFLLTNNVTSDNSELIEFVNKLF